MFRMQRQDVPGSDARPRPARRPRPVRSAGILFAVFLLAGIGLALAWPGRSFSAPTVLSAVWLLGAAAALALYCVLRTRSLLNPYSLALISFAVCYPLSAVVHFLRDQRELRGYYQLGALSGQHNAYVYASLALVLLALVAFWLGLGVRTGAPKPVKPKPAVASALLLTVSGLFFVAVGLLGVVWLLEGEDIYDVLTTVDRSRYTVGGGTARYAFLSHWYSWGVIFLLLAWVIRGRILSSFRQRVAFGAALFLLPVTIFYVGGRAYIFVWFATFILVLRHFTVRLSRLFIAALLLGYVVIALTISQQRAGAYRGIQPAYIGDYLTDIVDWEYGRFSMIGAGIELVDARGHGWGESTLFGLVYVVAMPYHYFRAPLPIQQPQPAFATMTNYLTGSQLGHIVPGAISDLYYDFGVFGVAVGCYLLGRFVRFAGARYENSHYTGSICFWAYTAVVLAVWTLPLSLTGWVAAVVTDGVPPICLVILEAASRSGVGFDRRSLSDWRACDQHRMG